MIILGWHGGVIPTYQDALPGWSTHDAAVAIIEDGELVFALEEERLNRFKHCNSFPLQSVRKALLDRGITFDDIDVIAMNFRENDSAVFPCDVGLPSVDRFLSNPDQLEHSVRDAVAALFSMFFGVDVKQKLFFCEHHEAHLFSAFDMSGFPSALGISLDGAGDCKAGRISSFVDNTVNHGRILEISDSLGNLYSDTIRLLGYNRFDEYKVMGLAPYGDPSRYADLFSTFYMLEQNGSFRLMERRERWQSLFSQGLTKSARRNGQSFTQSHKDIAASLQQCLEDIVMHMLTAAQRASGQTRLAYAGGVAHNCTLNGKILASGVFEEMFVQPAAHDAGGAIGAALAAHRHHKGQRARSRLPHLYLGGDVAPNEEIEAHLAHWSPALTYEHFPDIEAEAANLLVDQKVCAWVQGRSEFGPRSLGNRSILADPRPKQNQHRINQMIKKREGYRPFAPAILEEHLSDYFIKPKTAADLSFMNYVLHARKTAPQIVHAVTHIDGTSRVQAVSKKQNPMFWKLIEEFRKRTDLPMVLNTSFNNNAEPIVDSVYDAVVTFLTTDLDSLIVGNFRVSKKADFLSRSIALLSSFTIELPETRKLVRRSGPLEATYAIEPTSSESFGSKSESISHDLFHQLSGIEAPTVESVLGNNASADEGCQILVALWEKRHIQIRPPNTISSRIAV